jgi:serine/threonine protein kinase
VRRFVRILPAVSLAAGVRLGHFEISTLIGAGGMGEVYKARDTRLDRTVAIKVLPADVASDLPSRQRLEREARAISALNHPRICTLYDVGSADGIDFLVMEFLQGETLAHYIKRKGVLPIAEVVSLGVQVADALAAAHQQGIVHRDLKPENIMLTGSGVKLLDFGVAHLRRTGTFEESATLTRDGVTLVGQIVGTLPYLAPEQLAGSAADSRADVFAFGAILFEMLTGHRAFDAPTAVGVMAAVLAPPPSAKAVRPETPDPVDRLITECLARNPDERWQSTADLIRHLELIAKVIAVPTAVSPHSRTRRSMGIAALIAAGLVAGWLIPSGLKTEANPAAVILDVAPPPNTTLLTTSSSIPIAQFAVAPDGRHLAFVAAGQDSTPKLWIRELSTGASRSLPGTDGAASPFWAPDSRGLAFFAAGRLLRTDLAGTAPTVIGEAVDARGGTWNSNGVIVFALGNGGLRRTSAAGGVSSPVTTLDEERGEVSHRWPVFLADGTRFIYLARGARPAIRLASLDATEPARVIVETFFAATISSAGELLFTRNRALVAQRLDVDSLELTGTATTLAPQIGTASTGSIAASVSRTGTLVYAVDMSSPGRLTWFDRRGNAQESVGPAADILDFELSSDARHLLSSRVDLETASSDIWMMDLTSGRELRLTDELWIEASAIFDPAASRVAYRSNRLGLADGWLRSTSGGAEELFYRGAAVNPTSWSSDGDLILFNESQSLRGTGWDVMVYSFSQKKAWPFIETRANELHGRFPPDGRWVAYSSDESGRWEVYVRALDGRGARTLVSTNGGFEPRWRADGKELFYLTPRREVVGVSVTTGDRFEAGTPDALVTARIDPLPPPLTVSNGYRKTYSVTPDGQRFLLNVLARENNTQAMTVVLNWPSLRR